MRNRDKLASLVATGLILGSLALTSGCKCVGGKETEKVISMNDLPPAVKPLAEKEVAGCKILEVEQEMEGGKTIYSITYDKAGTKMEVEYSADGKLLSKEKE